jgi:hypothetical protein
MVEDELRVVLCEPSTTDEDVERVLRNGYANGVDVTRMDTPSAVASEVYGEPVGSVQCDPATVALVANGLVILVEGKKLATEVVEYLRERDADARDATDEFVPEEG